MAKIPDSNMKQLLFITTLFLGPKILFAQTGYTPLVNIPQFTSDTGAVTIGSFLSGIMPFVIGIAGALAVIRIIIGGIQYMTTDAWNSKNEAKETIKGAIFGLLLAASSYTILYSVNPDLVKIDLGLKTSQNNAISTSTLPGVGGTGFLTARALGCTDDCTAIPADEMGVRQGACNNNPCYVNDGLIKKLNSIVKLRWNDTASSTRASAWQITKAFPRNGDADTCYAPIMNGDNPLGGRCLELSIPNTSDQSVKAFVEALNATFGIDFHFYYVTSPARATAIRNIPGLNPAVKAKILYPPGGTSSERAEIRMK